MILLLQKITATFQLFLILSLFLENASGEEAKKISFYKDIRPIFQEHCNGCHQPAKMKGDYLMTEFSSLLQGGESGKKAVVPGNPDSSYLIDQIKPDKAGFSEMPKGKDLKPLHSSQFQKIVQWIKQN